MSWSGVEAVCKSLIGTWRGAEGSESDVQVPDRDLEGGERSESSVQVPDRDLEGRERSV